MNNRILVVDDEESVRRLLKRFLERKGYAVSTASGGKEALECIQRDRPQLMLLDMRMPQMDGMAVLQALRKLDMEIGVIMITSNDDETLAKQAMELGASDYITKPFDLEYLETSVMAKLALIT